MKVLQILPSLELGGVERGVIDLVRGMKRLGEESVVISSGGSLVKELQKMGVPHYSLPVHEKSPSSLTLISQIADIIRRENVDIVHARSRVPAWLAYFAARQTGAAFVTTCHGYYSTHFLSRVMGWGRRVIVISRVIARHMMDDFKVLPEKIRLIHRGVDLSQFEASQAKPTSAMHDSARPFRVINIGRLSPIKGQLEFLHAIHHLRSRVPNLRVQIVGSEDRKKTKYTAELLETIERLGLASCVEMLGTRRDIPELLAQSDLLVLSTLVPEAFGRVLVEAGAMGKPVIATRLGGVLDILDHEENGLMVTPGDVREMADAMHRIYLKPEEAAHFSARLQEKVRAQFSLDLMVKKTLEVYEEVRAEKKILVMKLGAMGDLILITPSLRMIRERFPKAYLSLLVDRKWAPLMDHCPYLDALIPVDRSKMSRPDYTLKLAKKIRTEGFDISIDFQNSKWTHLAAFLGGISKRYGFSRGAFGFLLNAPDRTFGIAEAPVRQQYRILSKLGVREFSENLELWPSQEAEESIQKRLESLPSRSGSRIGLIVGSSPQWMTKRWPIEYFKTLAERLVKELKAQVFLLGGLEDRDRIKGIFGSETEGVVNWVGETSLHELHAVIRHLNVLVTGDTAPLHMASAAQIKIVALFGPTDPRRHMPPSPHAVVLHRALPCAPCYQGVCKNTEVLACLRKIPVQDVFEAVRRHLASGLSKLERVQEPVIEEPISEPENQERFEL